MRDSFFDPGMFVRHPDRPDWGLGQVQSALRGRVTVTFEDAGKQVIDTAIVRLEFVGEDPRGS